METGFSGFSLSNASASILASVRSDTFASARDDCKKLTTAPALSSSAKPEPNKILVVFFIMKKIKKQNNGFVVDTII